MFSKCFIKHKVDTKTVIEAEHKARTDPEYETIIKSYAHAESELIKAKLRAKQISSIYRFKKPSEPTRLH